MTLEWKDPPPRKKFSPAGVYEQEAAELKANPGRWALLALYGGDRSDQAGRAMAANIRGGRYRAFRPRGHFEARSARLATATEVYARYVGPEKEEDA